MTRRIDRRRPQNALLSASSALLLLLGLPLGVPAADETESPMPPPGEAPWRPLEFRSIPKTTQYTTRSEDGRTVLTAETDCGASGLVLRLHPPVDLRETPRLAWRWRITLPLGPGARAVDERSQEGDDFAARVYVLFPFDRENASLLDRMARTLGERWYGSEMPGATLTYVWPRTVDRDTTWTSAFRDEVKLVAAEAPTADAGPTGWRDVVVDVARDARLGLGLAEEVPVVGIGLMTDADGTCDVAAAEYADFRWLGPAARAAHPNTEYAERSESVTAAVTTTESERIVPTVARTPDVPRPHGLP
ncbi:MAG: DUF3047 domain-containing protein [Myxococcota bacterium]